MFDWVLNTPLVRKVIFALNIQPHIFFFFYFTFYLQHKFTSLNITHNCLREIDFWEGKTNIFKSTQKQRFMSSTS